MTNLQKVLDENIPKDVISTREAGGGKTLDYLEAWYVIDRLNQVFGSLKWSNTIEELTQLPGTDDMPAYRAKVRLTINTEGNTVIVKEGIGFGSDKYKGKNAHELAMKEASSDALKVAAKNLGRSMGLALYDKSKEFIGVNNSVVANSTTTAKPASGPRNETNKPSGTSKVAPKKIIRQAHNTLTARRLITTGDFKTKYLSGKLIDDLTDTEATEVLTAVATAYPELNLN